VGAFMVMKRDLYTDLGGFDENCFMYSDDIDLSYRALLNGKKNYYYHETTVIHYKGESTIKDGAYMKRFQEAMNFFYKKHFQVSFFFSFFMKIGIVFFSIVKRMQGKALPKQAPENYILITDSETVQNKLTQKLQKKISSLPLENGKIVFSQSISKGGLTEIIVDTKAVSFKETIAFLEQNNNNSFTFKVLPIGSEFILGSNSSNDRGEVINL
jgi:hypothetical protein